MLLELEYLLLQDVFDKYFFPLQGSYFILQVLPPQNILGRFGEEPRSHQKVIACMSHLEQFLVNEAAAFLEP